MLEPGKKVFLLSSKIKGKTKGEFSHYITHWRTIFELTVVEREWEIVYKKSIRCKITSCFTGKDF